MPAFLRPSRAGRRGAAWALASFLTLMSLAPAATPAPTATAAESSPGAALRQELRSLGQVATLLHIAAHPDDENTQLITYFARGRGYRTAYLSLTRGDGGQNEIGPEFDEKLGVARTQELLAARRLDGGRQFFTRAIDFGFSKTPEETLTFWDRQQVLGDVVRILRQFRPDVVVTRFPPPPGSGGHGHHTASAILAVEAFKLAGDPQAYPEQLKEGLKPWQPKRVVWNGFSGGRGPGGSGIKGPAVRADIGGKDPVTGEDFGLIAARSRGLHITQGFAGFAARGSSGPREETFTHLGGDVAEKDLFDGIDTGWTRYPGGAALADAVAKALEAFRGQDPSASVPALLALRTQLAALPDDPVVADKRAQLDRLIQGCLGLTVETRAAQAEVVPGERIDLATAVTLARAFPVTLVRRGAEKVSVPLAAGVPVRAVLPLAVPADAVPSQPYWLRQDSSAGIARVDDAALIGRPENPAAFPVEYAFELGGQTLVVRDEPVHVAASPKGERRRRLDVIPAVSLRMAADVSLFQPGGRREVIVEVAAARAGAKGVVRLALPVGWSASPESRPFQLAEVGGKAQVAFDVQAPAAGGTGRATAVADVDGRRSSNQRIEIDYAHLPLQLLQPPARARLVSVEHAAGGRAVGYLPGAGDDTAAALGQLGHRVKVLSGADLTPEGLRGLDAVVIGVRAFNERRDLADHLPALWAWVEGGGTVVAQYNRPNGLRSEALGPYALSIQGSAPQQRVTDETAAVTVLQPDHAALNRPNRITPADFAGWVQERGAYFPSSWDEAHYTPLFAMNDPGEAPLKGSVLVARHGRGHFVYTGLAFFRQLPAGVPGAYRLFANLVALAP